jgi:hypothetical protein
MATRFKTGDAGASVKNYVPEKPFFSLSVATCADDQNLKSWGYLSKVR